MRRSAIAIVGLAAVACTGSDGGLSRVQGSGFFSPAELDYGVRTIGQRHELITTLRNSSPQTLRIQRVRFEPTRNVYQAVTPEGASIVTALLAPGASIDIAVRYSPINEGDDDATMLIEFEEIEVPLPITAKARFVAPAEPELTPGTISFFNTEVGRDVSQVVTIRNIGDTHGALEAVRGERPPFTVTDLGGAPLELPSELLAPGEAKQVEVHFKPVSEDTIGRSFVFEFDTDLSATLEVTGQAIPAGVLTCQQMALDYGEVPRGQTITRSVQCESDGGPYDLREIRIVPGSAVGFSIPNQPTGLDSSNRLSFDVVFDAAGLPRRYDGALEIVAEHDAITRVPILAVVVPPLPGTTDLTVAIDWNTARSDIDLHVVRRDGTMFADGDDCYFEDRNPDWGRVGDEADDPFLDVDDVDGLGPEEMNLSQATELSYDVYAHYYGYMGPFPPSTTVNVTYRIRGAPEVLVAQELNDCGRAWHVGTFFFDTDPPRFVPANAYTDAYKAFASEPCR